MATPAWLGAEPGGTMYAAQINQFLGTHQNTFVYTGALIASQTTAGSGSVNSNGVWNAQSFATGSFTTTGRFAFNLVVTGGPAPITLSLQANNAGVPSGTALTSTTVSAGWGNATAAYQSIPLVATGLTASTTYWLVASSAGDASDFYQFNKSNQASGAATSSNGTSWTAQAYGLLFDVWDLSAVPPLQHTWEDQGARATRFFYNSNATPGALEEYTLAEGGHSVYSYRTYNYASGEIVSIT